MSWSIYVPDFFTSVFIFSDITPLFHIVAMFVIVLPKKVSQVTLEVEAKVERYTIL
jgi:hypothetical protein